MSRASCPRHGDRHMEEDGPVRWCSDCAWEDPENPAEVPPPAKEREVEPAGIESIGTKDLARLCKTRIAEIEAALSAAERKFREQSAGARVELGRLRKIVAFCEGPSTSAPAKPKDRNVGGAVSRDPNDSRNAWTCPDCGHRTVSRWVSRHKAECPAKAGAA